MRLVPAESITNPMTAERREATTSVAGGLMRLMAARKKYTDTAIRPTPAQRALLENLGGMLASSPCSAVDLFHDSFLTPEEFDYELQNVLHDNEILIDRPHNILRDISK